MKTTWTTSRTLTGTKTTTNDQSNDTGYNLPLDHLLLEDYTMKWILVVGLVPVGLYAACVLGALVVVGLVMDWSMAPIERGS